METRNDSSEESGNSSGRQADRDAQTAKNKIAIYPALISAVGTVAAAAIASLTVLATTDHGPSSNPKASSSTAAEQSMTARPPPSTTAPSKGPRSSGPGRTGKPEATQTGSAPSIEHLTALHATGDPMAAGENKIGYQPFKESLFANLCTASSYETVYELPAQYWTFHAMVGIGSTTVPKSTAGTLQYRFEVISDVNENGKADPGEINSGTRWATSDETGTTLNWRMTKGTSLIILKTSREGPGCSRPAVWGDAYVGH
jgi:hypothetical protein